MTGEVALELSVPSYNAGFIILSYVLSFFGCATTLELLHRRTSRWGIYNWYLLFTAAISMGGIGIWCMHFIGNRAVVFAGGEHDLQIFYSSTFTAVSFFLPIGVLVIAFYFIGISENADILYIVATGTLTGGAVCGMHYLGNLGIANYSCSYKIPNIVGAAIIAVSASITALGVFFRLRASWSNSWWKRLLSAAVLGLAVSGMHWTAAVGTNYRHKDLGGGVPSQLSSTQTVIVCAVLGFVACGSLVGLAIVGNRKHKRSAKRVRQLVLACAFFDPSGRVMVTTEGHLPTQEITNHYMERSFADDEFSKTHPAFIWAFRASRNWLALKSLIPSMKNHLASDEAIKRYRPGNGSPVDNGAELDIGFEFIFKELFCVAAQQLADRIQQPLEDMGELYEDIFVTGTQTSATVPKKAVNQLKNMASTDLENASFNHIIGKGQFVFTVRQLSKQETSHLSAIGFRFAAIPQIALTLARSVQVPLENVLERFEQMREYLPSEKMMSPGVHFVCFLLQVSVHKGFDVLVQKDATNVLPHVSLPIEQISPWQMDIISRMDEWTLTTCLKWLNEGGGYNDLDAQAFCQEMYRAISKLANQVGDVTFGHARFSAKRIMIPCKSNSSKSYAGRCTAFSFRIVNGLQNRISTGNDLCFAPLRLFNAQQQVYPGVADQDHFRKTLLEEFTHCNDDYLSKPDSSTSSILAGASPPGISLWHKIRRTPSEDSKVPITESLGGIMASTQVTVDITGATYNDLEMQEMGHTSDVRYGGPRAESETFVDELCSLCQNTLGRRASPHY